MSGLFIPVGPSFIKVSTILGLGMYHDDDFYKKSEFVGENCEKM